MLKIGLIGSGNVAIHLARAFSQPGNAVLAGIYARTPDFPEAASLPLVHSAEALSACDLIVIAVSDDAIARVEKRQKRENEAAGGSGCHGDARRRHINPVKVGIVSGDTLA